MQNLSGSEAILKYPEIRDLVFARDDHTCQMCGATADDIDGGAMTIAVFPLQPLLMTPTEIDLKTLCPDCVAGIEAPNFSSRVNTETLLAQVRDATDADQLAALNWLLKKYPNRGAQ